MLPADAARISAMDDLGLFCESYSTINSCDKELEIDFQERESETLVRTPLIH